MKRSLLFAAVLSSAFATPIAAQEKAIQIGVDFGAVIAKVVGDSLGGPDSRVSPYAGLSLVVHKPGSRFGFQTGLSLVPKGLTFKDEDVEATLAINYVEVPLLLRIALPLRESNIVPALLLGGSLGIKTSCNSKFKAGGVSTKVACEDATDDDELDLKTVDFGVSGGIEVAIPVGTRFYLAPTLRYTRGLTNISDNSGDVSVKNTAFQIGAMFRIRM